MNESQLPADAAHPWDLSLASQGGPAANTAGLEELCALPEWPSPPFCSQQGGSRVGMARAGSLIPSAVEITTEIHLLLITCLGVVPWLCDLPHPLSRWWILKAEISSFQSWQQPGMVGKRTGNSEMCGELYPRGGCGEAQHRAGVGSFVFLMAICFQSCTTRCLLSLARQIFSLFQSKTCLLLAGFGNSGCTICRKANLHAEVSVDSPQGSACGDES